MSEIIDVIDENNHVVGHEPREKVHELGLPHRVSAVLIKRPDGKYMIPTASEHKLEAGGLFHSAGGHVMAGEAYRASAVRELWEETGLTAQEDDLLLLGSYWFEKEYPSRKEKERFEVFEMSYSPEMGEIELNYEQHSIQWFSKEELLDLYSKSPQTLSNPLRLTCQQIFS